MPSVSNEMANGSKSLFTSLPGDEFESILDVGTGNGHSAEYFIERDKM
jgi:16S rRNA G1207 methylase RsmC